MCAPTRINAFAASAGRSIAASGNSPEGDPPKRLGTLPGEPRMRIAAIVAVALLGACRPEPRPIVEPAAIPEPTVEVGTAVAVAELGEGWEHRAVVDDAGRIALPSCGDADVRGATASAACERIASCLATTLREPLVEIAFERARASCRGRGEPLPQQDALLETVATQLGHGRFEPQAIEELVDVAVARHAALLRRTDAHPQVREQTERVQRLLEARAGSSAPRLVAAQHVARRLAEAEQARGDLPEGIGPEHPRSRIVARRIEALQRLADAVGVEPLPPAMRWVLDHERALVDHAPPPAGPPDCAGTEHAFALRIAYWQGRRDAAIDPTEAERILDGLVRAAIDTAARCDAPTRSPPP